LVKKLKEPKIIKVVGNITYYESDYSEEDELKPKRVVTWETKQKLSAKRKAVKKQPRAGQSKKAQNFFSQLNKDYITQSSAMGKFQRGKGKDDYESEMLRHLFENQEINDEQLLEGETNLSKKDDKDKDGFKLFIKIEDKHKKEIKKWMNKNKNKLENIALNEGIMSEYDIMNVNFSQVKMTDNLIENLDLGANHNNIVNVNYDKQIMSKDIKDKHYFEGKKFLNALEYELEHDQELFFEFASDKFIDFLYDLDLNEKQIKYYSSFYHKVCQGYFKLFFKKANMTSFIIEDLIDSSNLIIYSFLEDKFDANIIYRYLKDINLGFVKATEIRELLENLDK